MRIACNRNNLKKHARALLGNEYSEEKEKELMRECLQGFERTHGHISHDYAKHLDRIGKILGTHGTEGGLYDKHGNDLGGTCSMQGVKHDLQYCNTGETYAITIMYYNGKLSIGDWGSIFE